MRINIPPFSQPYRRKIHAQAKQDKIIKIMTMALCIFCCYIIDKTRVTPFLAAPLYFAWKGVPTVIDDNQFNSLTIISFILAALCLINKHIILYVSPIGIFGCVYIFSACFYQSLKAGERLLQRKGYLN